MGDIHIQSNFAFEALSTDTNLLCLWSRRAQLNLLQINEQNNKKGVKSEGKMRY